MKFNTFGWSKTAASLPMIPMRILSVCFVALIGSLSLYGQQELNVRSMGLNRGEMPELFFATRGELKLTPVEWPTRQPSIAVLALRDGSLPLYRKEVGDDGKVMPVVAHRVQIPAGAKEVLLFGWLDKGELHLHAVEDNFLTAKHNDWLLINLSQKDIFFRVGEDTAPTRVDSGKSKFYRIDVDANKGTSVIGGANIRGKERLFYSTYLPIQEGERTIMLFSTDGDKIRTKPVYDKFKRRPE